jgi:hypothetical protein
MYGKSHLDQKHHEAKCLKIVKLLDQGLERSIIRERFGLTISQLNHMIDKGRKILKAPAELEEQ